MINENNYQGTEIAIIGISGRFPAADSPEAFWKNLTEGKECIRFFSEEELLKSGVEQSEINNPNYVRAKGQMNDIEMFDASFFGYSPKEAENMDPQHRLFLEFAWTVIENAGYNVEKCNNRIGVFAGLGMNNYYINHILNSKESTLLGPYQTAISNVGDTLCTRVSYKLNLKGPSLTVQTACSTSLVSVHIACQNLLLRECDMAIAGGVKVMFPRNNGYLYSEGGITSPDGHCRTFDSKSRGMVPGEGVGLVLLKRLEDAIADRDHIYSIIRGSAINNDGSLKIGFTAPGIEGQSQVIVDAQSVSGVESSTITYIEAHGTATQLGDPVEMKALTVAFNTDKRNYCSVGSVKSNVGHLDSAAGVTGLIKTALMLEHKKLVPSLYFITPNPKIDFKNSPFFVNTEYRDWDTNGIPRRAGVSSFGIGGTNVHVILEEAPRLIPSSSGRKNKLLLFSAKTASALDKTTQNLASFLNEKPNDNLSDIAYTLQVGRKSFNYRRMLVCSDSNEAISFLNPVREDKVYTGKVKEEGFSLVFMFPGQGSQYVKMGCDLYHTEPFFRQKIDECLNIISPLFEYDIKSILFSGEINIKTINQTEFTQPLLFVIEYSLATLLMHWGITPSAMIGHSIGEYVAACLSGVFTLEEALRLVVMRGKLMQGLPTGAMLSVALPEKQLVDIINDKVSIAAINTDSSCVLSGSHEVITKIVDQLEEKGIVYRILETSHAFHSDMMDPILSKFEDEVKQMLVKKNQIPYISNITGKWITQEQVQDPSYWTKHLRQTVRFHDGISELSSLSNVVFIEVGPGKALSTLVRQAQNQNSTFKTFNLLRHPNENISDDYYLATKIGQLWLQGIEINWVSYYSNETRNRIPLPTYPFERQKYWVEASQKNGKKRTILSKKQDISDWFYVPSWEQSINNELDKVPSQALQWLIFTEDNNYCKQIIKHLERDNQKIKTVFIGTSFIQENDSTYLVNPAIEEDYIKLFQTLKSTGAVPDRILHLWNISKDLEKKLIDQIETVQNNGLYSLLNIAKSIGLHNIDKKIELDVVTSDIHSITGEENINPLKATLLSAIKIIPLEYLNISCRNIDIGLPLSNNKVEEITNQIYNEIRNESLSHNVVGYRGYYRWVLNYKALRLEAKTKSETTFRLGGIYLISGGFGGMGMSIAKFLAKEYKAKLILIGRTSIPLKEEWDKYLEIKGTEDAISSRILRVRELEQYGSEIMICNADVSDYKQMSPIVKRAEKEFGAINGVIHTAGSADYFGIIQNRSKEQTEEIIAPKVKGTLVLDSLVKHTDLDFFICFSSMGNQIYHIKFGQIGYGAGNEFLDAFSHYKRNDKVVVYRTINWTDWLERGMAIEAIKRKRKNEKNIDFASVLIDAITPAEGIEILCRVLNSKTRQIIISKMDLHSLFEEKRKKHIEKISGNEIQEDLSARQLKSRPELSTNYKSPETETEKKLIKIFEGFFGYEQIGINDDFFEMGGDSLKAINLISKIHKELDVKISMAEIFNYSTIIKLSKLIEGSSLNVFTNINKAPEQEYYPISSNQKRLFVLQQFDENSTAYNVSTFSLLNGKLNYEMLELAIKQIIRKHEAFRTSFVFARNVLVQRVEEDVDFHIEHLEMKLEDLSNAVLLGFIQPFNLSKSPLLRVKLCKVGSDKHMLLIDMHHIICDGVSWSLFMHDLRKAYVNQDIGRLKIQYKDYVVWEQSNLNDQISKKRENYWLNIYKDNIPVLNLPIDYPRPETQNFEGARCRFELSEETSQSLYALCDKYNVTLYMLLLSLYNILLSKYANTEDLIVGTVNAGREHEDVKNIIGMFVNTLAIRTNPVSSKKFTDYLNEVKSIILRAFENQQYPFEELIDKLNISRNLNRNPLFDTLFTVQNFEMEKLKIGDLVDEYYSIEGNIALFDITLAAFETGSTIFYLLDYCIKLFKEDTIKRLGNHLNHIIKQVVEDPERLISEIEINTTEEYFPPTSEIEKEVCKIWQEVLGLDKVGIKDNFFKIGGNNILAMQVSSRISKDLGLDIQVSDIFKFKSISELLSNITLLKVDEENVNWKF